MKILSKIDFFSIFFLLLFIAPHTVVSVISQRSTALVYYPILVVSYLIFIVFFLKEAKKIKYISALIFALLFVLTGIFNMIIHNSTSTFNIIAPVISYFAYVGISKNSINVKYFDYYILILYIYFYFIYYSILPNLIFRPGFDEEIFENASSNAIPIALNVTLYAYLILNKFASAGREKRIFIFSIVNIILIVIQQSRAGVLISIVIFLISLYNYQREKFFKFLIPLLVAFFIGVSSYYYTEIVTYIDHIGNVKGLQALKEDSRGDAFSSFFRDMDIFNFLFGYSNRTYGAGEFSYTYNMYLEIWNKYGLIQLTVFFSVLIHRFIKRSKFEFPFYFLFPFLLYTIVEPRFFPGFWDVIVYILLFAPRLKNIISTNERGLISMNSEK